MLIVPLDVRALYCTL